MKVAGLKCDNPNCDWKDESIPYKDMKKYINAKCPKCGMILLTKKEYLMLKFISAMERISNKIFKGKDMKTIRINIIDEERFKDGK